jgi:Zn-dependent metalloprotease
MKKYIAALAGLLCLVGLLASVPAAARTTSKLNIVAGQGTRAPKFVSGISADVRKGSPVAIARAHLQANASRYAIDNQSRDLAVLDVIRNEDTATVRFGQRYKGFEVWGAQYLVHLRRSSGGYAPESVNGHFFTELDTDGTARISVRAAIRIARARHRELTIARIDRNGLKVLPEGKGLLVHHVTLWGSSRDGTPARQEVFVSAHRGVVALSYNNLHFDGPTTGTGVRAKSGAEVPMNIYQRGSIYEARDQGREMFTTDGGEIITHNAKGAFFGDFIGIPSDDTIATDPDTRFDGANTKGGIVDAHFGASVTYEFFRALGRNSIDDNGMDIISVANTKDFGGFPFDNAFWDGEKMVYGKGSPKRFYPFSSALDVVAHELTHGVTDFSGDLVYLNQSGAMNEAYSDYFGNAVQVNIEGIPMTSPQAAGPGPSDLPVQRSKRRPDG